MGRRSKPQTGTVYVIHFETRLKHAGHYLGYCDDLARRIAQHRSGNGARLMEVIAAAGIAWKVVRIWPGDRGLERRLKRRKNTPRRLCPVCRGEVAYDEVDERRIPAHRPRRRGRPHRRRPGRRASVLTPPEMATSAKVGLRGVESHEGRTTDAMPSHSADAAPPPPCQGAAETTHADEPHADDRHRRT